MFSVKSNNNKISTKVFSSIRYNWNKKEGDNKPDKEGKVRKLCRKKSRSWKSWFEGRESAEESYALLNTDKEKSVGTEDVIRHANNTGNIRSIVYRVFHSQNQDILDDIVYVILSTTYSLGLILGPQADLLIIPRIKSRINFVTDILQISCFSKLLLISTTSITSAFQSENFFFLQKFQLA